MTIDFMSKRKFALVASGILLLVSVASLIFSGLNRGLDFTGGVLVELGFSQPVDPETIRDLLAENGYLDAVVQNFGTEREVLIRVPPIPDIDQSNLGYDIQQLLRLSHPDVDLRRSEFVGPAVGEELTEMGGIALLVALIMVMIYIMFRFTGKFALGAVTALVHDVLVVIGAFSLMRWTFNLPELAALLAVIGYSLNDTIVVSDRIRENFRGIKRGRPIDVINRSLNQTLGRTLVTSLTTLLVLLALLIAGGEQVTGFATALTIGVVVGTYSSIYVSASMLLWLGIQSEELALPVKENA